MGGKVTRSSLITGVSLTSFSKGAGASSCLASCGSGVRSGKAAKAEGSCGFIASGFNSDSPLTKSNVGGFSTSTKSSFFSSGVSSGVSKGALSAAESFMSVAPIINSAGLAKSI